MFKDIVVKNRSYRRFYEGKRIGLDMMKSLVEMGHLTPSGANKQPVRFTIVESVTGCEKVYPTLRWAGYYTDWDGPVEGERPSGYIVMLTPGDVNCQWDEGIIGQTILLAATDAGLGGCFIANIDREKLSQIINVPEGFKISLVIALGYPKEEVVIDTISADGDIKYYRDNMQVHHVPKINYEEVIADII